MFKKNTKLQPVAVIASLLMLAPIASWAFDRDDNEAIDAIDHIFSSGEETYSGELANDDDVAWIVFEATVGDVVSFEVGVPDGEGCRNAALLAPDDQKVEIGDIYIGPLRDDAENSDFTELWEYEDDCDSEGGDFEATYTGQYVIAIESYQNDECCGYSVTLSGNVVPVIAAPPTPVATMPVYGLALAALGLMILCLRRLRPPA